MALMKCPECGTEVNDRASACPKCGFPIQEEVERLNKQKEEELTRIESEKEKANNVEKIKYICRKCHFQNRIGAVQCVICNTPIDAELADPNVCPFCGGKINHATMWCVDCGHKFVNTPAVRNAPTEVQRQENITVNPEPHAEQQKPPFNGIYRVGLFGDKKEVYCPRCGSEKCQWVIGSQYVPEVSKTKTRYTMNLNPLHPFTLANKKEKKKVLLPAHTVQTRSILCNNCGHTFS